MSPKKTSHTSSSSSCHKNLIKLYSSRNFGPGQTVDSKPIKRWDVTDEKIVFESKFVSSINIANVDEYFKAHVSFEAYKTHGQYVIKNIVVRDICFKSQVNVSLSSRTDDYNYLYDISCSSADNSSSTSTSSSSYSISSIINGGIEKQIAASVKSFFAGNNGVYVSWAAGVGYLNLDVAGIPSDFTSAKLIAKYRLVPLRSSTSSSDSSSSTSSVSSSTSSSFTSSSTKKHEENKYFKLGALCAVVALIVVFVLNMLKNKPQPQIPHVPQQLLDLLNNLKQIKGNYLN